MDIAVCFSGIARGQVDRNVEHAQRAFSRFGSVDFFFATWKEHENDISRKYNAVTYPEPEIHYDAWTECVVDNPHHKYKQYKDARLKGVEAYYQNPTLKNSLKQILAHAYQVEDLPQKYDMIVRLRWDVITSPTYDFRKYMNQSYEKNIAIGFAIRGERWISLNSCKDIDHVYCTVDTAWEYSRDWCYWINDNMIFHPRKIWDSKKAWKLFKEKRLWPAEYGWYQLLSNMDDHHCVYGGAAIERFRRVA